MFGLTDAIVATRVRTLEGWTDAAVYELSRPYEYLGYDDGPDSLGHLSIQHVVVAVMVRGVPPEEETVVFPVRPGAEASNDLSVLLLSKKWLSRALGTRDHSAAIEGAGWVPVEKVLLRMALLLIATLTGGQLVRHEFVRVAEPKVDGYRIKIGVNGEKLSVKASLEASNAAALQQSSSDAIVTLDRLEGLGLVHGGDVPGLSEHGVIHPCWDCDAPVGGVLGVYPFMHQTAELRAVFVLWSCPCGLSWSSGHGEQSRDAVVRAYLAEAKEVVRA
jgi:hypothetical protein